MGVVSSHPSAAADEKVAAQNIGHFDNTYDAALLASSEGLVPEATANNQPNPDAVAKVGPGRIVALVMKFERVEVKETLRLPGEGPTTRVLTAVPYGSLKSLHWDHSVSAVKLVMAGTRERPSEDAFLALKVPNSLELESEAKLRLRGLASASGAQAIHLSFTYVGVYAGPTKPKPFQRKRANLGKHEQGKLPPLTTMREVALARHTGSGAPTRSKVSKRLRHAIDEIHKGVCSFTVVNAQERGKPPSTQMLAVESRLQLCPGYPPDVPGVAYAEGQRLIIRCDWGDVLRYEVWDRAHQGEHANGVEFFLKDGRIFFFVVLDVLQLAEAVEHFWNRTRAAKKLPPMPRSTHGREVQKITTLHGEIEAPPAPEGDLDVLDEKGVLVRRGPSSRETTTRQQQESRPSRDSKRVVQVHAGMAKRKSTLVGSVIKGKKPLDFRTNPRAAKYWDSMVKHQGWLLKLGGVGLKRQWIKRYAVLYSTAMGHFLCYYSDFAKSPLFHVEERERRVIDLSKTTFVRPVSNNKEAPTNSFDICTIEREWTLSAESKASMQQWLQVITRAVDEDVAVVPDDELVFTVKPRVDPSGKLLKNEYSTALKVSASGVSVCHVAANDEFQEKFFWCYTDFFKWSILHHSGKTGLQVSIFTSTDFDVKDRQEFLFRTRDAVKLATAVEFYIEKFMAAMHLYLEGEESTSTPAPAPAALVDGVEAHVDDQKKTQNSNTNMNFDATAMGQDALVTDDLIGVEDDNNDDDDDLDDFSRRQQAENQRSHNGNASLLDIFTVDNDTLGGGGGGGPFFNAPDDPFAPKPLHAVDDPFAPQPVTHPAFGGAEHTGATLFGGGPGALGSGDAETVVSDLTGPPLHRGPVSDPFLDHHFGTNGATAPAAPPPPPPPPGLTQQQQPQQWGEEQQQQQPLGVSSSSSLPPVVVDATESMIAESPLFDALTRLNESAGVLFENNAVSVSVSQEYRGSQGRVFLTVRNDYPPRDQGGLALENAEIDVDLGATGLRHHVSELAPSALEPGEEATAQLMLECMQPFDEAPAAILKFTIEGQRYELKVALPSLFTKFLEAAELAPQVFVQRWATLGAPGLEQMDTFTAKEGRANAAFAKPRLETLVNLAFAAGVDDNDGTILSGAAALRTGTTNAGGDKISVGCLVRLEMNEHANAYRLTVRTAVPTVSRSLAQAIIAVL